MLKISGIEARQRCVFAGDLLLGFLGQGLGSLDNAIPRGMSAYRPRRQCALGRPALGLERNVSARRRVLCAPRTHSQASLTGTNCTRSQRFATKMKIIRYVSCRDIKPKTYISMYEAGREVHTLAINTLSFNRL